MLSLNKQSNKKNGIIIIKNKEAGMASKSYNIRHQNGQFKVTSEQKKTIDHAAKKIAKQYGKTIKLLAQT
jgi:hypothetical protein